MFRAKRHECFGFVIKDAVVDSNPIRIGATGFTLGNIPNGHFDFADAFCGYVVIKLTNNFVKNGFFGRVYAHIRATALINCQKVILCVGIFSGTGDSTYRIYFQ